MSQDNSVEFKPNHGLTHLSKRENPLKRLKNRFIGSKSVHTASNVDPREILGEIAGFAGQNPQPQEFADLARTQPLPDFLKRDFFEEIQFTELGDDIFDDTLADLIVETNGLAIDQVKWTYLNTYELIQDGAGNTSLNKEEHDGYQRYQIFPVALGEGGMGSVYRLYDYKLERYVVGKVIKQVEDNIQASAIILEEAKKLAKLNNPYIVNMYDVTYIKVDDHLEPMMIMEDLTQEGYEQLDRLGNELTIDQLQNVVSHLGDALNSVHNAGYIHADLKPANIMVNPDGFVKLCDFGIAEKLSQDFRETRGTFPYMAPETLPDIDYNGRIINAEHQTPVQIPADVYAMGMVVYEMLLRKNAISVQMVDEEYNRAINRGRNNQAVLNMIRVIKLGVIDFPPAFYKRCAKLGINSNDMERVLKKALAREPENRYSKVKDLTDNLMVALSKPADNQVFVSW